MSRLSAAAVIVTRSAEGSRRMAMDHGARIQGISSASEGVDTVAAPPALDKQPQSDVATSAPLGACVTCMHSAALVGGGYMFEHPAGRVAVGFPPSLSCGH